MVDLSNECLEGVVDSHNRLVELDKELTGAKRVRAPRLHMDKIRQLALAAAVEESELMLATAKAQAYAEYDGGRAAEGPIKALAALILRMCKARPKEGVA